MGTRPSKRTSRTMRATTVRFGTDLWEMLEREAERSGVSVAQYVREAALTRIAYSAGRRGEEPFGAGPGGEPDKLRGEDLSDAAEAVKRQGRQAVRHSESIRETTRKNAARYKTSAARSAERSKQRG